jgi:hypothetical protein
MSYDEDTSFGGDEELDDLDIPLDDTMTDDFGSDDDEFDKDH